jgi:hypothetical protein
VFGLELSSGCIVGINTTFESVRDVEIGFIK